jgi:ribokinase
MRVDRPLLDRDVGGVVDRSVDGKLTNGAGLRIVDASGGQIDVVSPESWPGPTGTVEINCALAEGTPNWIRSVVGLSWHDDLGGMGAGYAAALGGELVSALGPLGELAGTQVSAMLAAEHILHRPVRVDHCSDWTLLITSAEFGDKLAIGFRGCHAAVPSFAPYGACDVRVVAGLPSRLAAEALRAPGARTRFFAPALRNMLDRDIPVASIADSVDFLSCNHDEWGALGGREIVAERVPIVAITESAAGSRVLYRNPDGGRDELSVPPFPRERPPRDTNRAGEAYAAELLTTLLDAGWLGGHATREMIRHAATRASAAAALVLDRDRFGFPRAEELNAAVRAGRVAGGPNAGPNEVG